MQNESSPQAKTEEILKHSRIHDLAQIVRKKISGWKRNKKDSGQPVL
jgi:hypothetical protein